jgi:hypothetical protein
MNDKQLQKLLKLSDAQVQRLRDSHDGCWNDDTGFNPLTAPLWQVVRQSVIDSVNEDAEQTV